MPLPYGKPPLIHSDSVALLARNLSFVFELHPLAQSDVTSAWRGVQYAQLS